MHQTISIAKPHFLGPPAPFLSLSVEMRARIHLHQRGVILFTISTEMLCWTLECTHGSVIGHYLLSFNFLVPRFTSHYTLYLHICHRRLWLWLQPFAGFWRFFLFFPSFSFVSHIGVIRLERESFDFSRSGTYPALFVLPLSDTRQRSLRLHGVGICNTSFTHSVRHSIISVDPSRKRPIRGRFLKGLGAMFNSIRFLSFASSFSLLRVCGKWKIQELYPTTGCYRVSILRLGLGDF